MVNDDRDLGRIRRMKRRAAGVLPGPNHCPERQGPCYCEPDESCPWREVDDGPRVTAYQESPDA